MSFARLLLLCPALLALLVTSSAQTTQFTCKQSAKTGLLSAATTFPGEAAPAGSAGFDLANVPSSFSGGACSSDKPFFFSIVEPDGDYRVSITLGGGQASTTTLRAESRRLLLREKQLPAGASATEEFIIHVRTPEIAGTPDKVRLKPREIGALDWDHKLTLEFNGEHPSLRALTISPAVNVPTLYLAGDSTVVDQDKEPWAAWGQMLPVFFTPRLAIANEAESGETIKSFVGERRLAKVMSTIKQGDFLMIQFAHNDQKLGAGYVPAATDYKDFLKSYIAQARAKGATPILVTAMNRRNFDAEGHITMTLGDYPAAMRDIALSEKVALIDLNAMSKTLFETMGPDGTLKAFVHYPADTFPGQTAELKDDTHFNAYGAYELARCIVQSIRDQQLPLNAFLRKDIATYNPATPDAFASWHLPPSPAISIETPYGR